MKEKTIRIKFHEVYQKPYCPHGKQRWNYLQSKNVFWCRNLISTSVLILKTALTKTSIRLRHFHLNLNSQSQVDSGSLREKSIWEWVTPKIHRLLWTKRLILKRTKKTKTSRTQLSKHRITQITKADLTPACRDVIWFQKNLTRI